MKHIKEILAENIDKAKYNLAVAEKRLVEAEAEAEQKKDVKGIDNWVGFTFESSSGLTNEWASFNSYIHNYVKKQLSDELELVNWSRGHFEFSGFIKNNKTGKFVYFSCSDVRFFKDSWYNNLLIRTAENENDYTGGSNCVCKMTDLSKMASKLSA